MGACGFNTSESITGGSDLAREREGAFEHLSNAANRSDISDIGERERHQRRSGWDYGSLPNPISRCPSPASGRARARASAATGAAPLRAPPRRCEPRTAAAPGAASPFPQPPAAKVHTLRRTAPEGQSRSSAVAIKPLGFNIHQYTAMKFHPAPEETFILRLIVIYNYALHLIM